jgi:hypothetical protein
MTGVKCHPRDGKEKYMAIVLVPKVNNYTIMSNHHIQRENSENPMARMKSFVSINSE